MITRVRRGSWWVGRVRRLVLWSRGVPGLVPASIMLLIIAFSARPVRQHLEAEAAAGPDGSGAFEVTGLDVLYGSIQLFTANMQPVTASDPSTSLRVLRVVGPLIVVWWVAGAFSRAARSLWTRSALRWFKGHVVLCGPEERILELVRNWRIVASSERRRLVAVTDAPLTREAERALRRLGAWTVSVVADGSKGAFANAVSRAHRVIIDFDETATTMRFAEAALLVGRRRGAGVSGVLGRWPLRALSSGPAEEVAAFVDEVFPAGLTAGLGLDPRLRVADRLGSMARAVSSKSDFVRGSMSAPMRLMVVTDDPDFVERTGVFRPVFRQAERRRVEVLLVGSQSAEPEDAGDAAGWRTVRAVRTQDDLEHALRWMVDPPGVSDDEQIPVGSPVVVCAEPFLALRVIAELLRIGRSRGGHAFKVAYAPSAPGTSLLLESDRLRFGDIAVVSRDPLELLRMLESAPPEVALAPRLASHLGLWHGEARAALGHAPNLDDPLGDGAAAAARIVGAFSRLGWEFSASDGGGEVAAGLGPDDLSRLFEALGADETTGSAADTLQRRASTLDVLARVPQWLMLAGYGMRPPGGRTGPSAGGPERVQLTDDDLRRMAAEAHATYLDTVGEQLADDVGDRDAVRAWERLTPAQQEANLGQVRHLPVKLALLDLTIARGDAGAVAWPDGTEPHGDVRRALARVEHSRWSLELVARGYQAGGRRSVEDRTHPDLVGFDELPETVVAFDLNVIDSMPRVLASAGLRIVRAT